MTAEIWFNLCNSVNFGFAIFLGFIILLFSIAFITGSADE